MTYKVKLQVFEGPLDLLLYLIKKEEINIYDIPIAKITEQYLKYLDVMQMLDLKLAGEFLLMASSLMQIKSKLLLPAEDHTLEEAEEPDPRAELVRRLIEYKRFKEAANRLEDMQREQAKLFRRRIIPVSFSQEQDREEPYFEASLFDLISAFSKVLKTVSKTQFLQIVRDEVTVEKKIHDLLHLLVVKPMIYFSNLFEQTKTKTEIIATFLAILELTRLKEILVRQHRSFDEIQITRHPQHIEAKGDKDAVIRTDQADN